MESPLSMPLMALTPSSRLHGSRFGGDRFGKSTTGTGHEGLQFGGEPFNCGKADRSSDRSGLRHHAGGCGRSGNGIVLLIGTRRSRRGTCLRGSIRSRRMGKEEFLRHDLRCERRTAVSRDLSLGKVSLYAGDLPARQFLCTPSRRTVPSSPMAASGQKRWTPHITRVQARAMAGSGSLSRKSSGGAGISCAA